MDKRVPEHMPTLQVQKFTQNHKQSYRCNINKNVTYTALIILPSSDYAKPEPYRYITLRMISSELCQFDCVSSLNFGFKDGIETLCLCANPLFLQELMHHTVLGFLKSEWKVCRRGLMK